MLLSCQHASAGINENCFEARFVNKIAERLEDCQLFLICIFLCIFNVEKNKTIKKKKPHPLIDLRRNMPEKQVIFFVWPKNDIRKIYTGSKGIPFSVLFDPLSKHSWTLRKAGLDG